MLLLFTIVLESCYSSIETHTGVSFYHWKQECDIGAEEDFYITELGLKNLYLRYFDVDWDSALAEPIPVSIVSLSDTLSFSIVPTVYITNRTFSNSSEQQLFLLADRILAKIESINAKYSLPDYSSLQIDCDWTISTRDKYFGFLNVLHKKLQNKHQKLSVTIRLHQLKYPEKTGVPPVDEGVLMFYNMGKISDYSESNSILNLGKAAPYLDVNKKYPLPLDFALPLFHWGLIFRHRELVHINNLLDKKALLDSTRFQAIDDFHFHVKKDTYLEGFYLYEGDEIRLEAITNEDLKESAEMLRPFVNQDTTEIIYYHLDSIIIQNYSTSVLNEVQRVFTENN